MLVCHLQWNHSFGQHGETETELRAMLRQLFLSTTSRSTSNCAKSGFAVPLLASARRYLSDRHGAGDIAKGCTTDSIKLATVTDPSKQCQKAHKMAQSPRKEFLFSMIKFAVPCARFLTHSLSSQLQWAMILGMVTLDF